MKHVDLVNSSESRRLHHNDDDGDNNRCEVNVRVFGRKLLLLLR